MLEGAVAHRLPQHRVHRVAQRGVGPGEHAHVVSDGDRLREDDEPGPTPAAQGALRDDVIQQHRVHAARDEVRVGVHVVVV